MASRRIRLKAVINLPQRRGKESEPSAVPGSSKARDLNVPCESAAVKDSVADGKGMKREAEDACDDTSSQDTVITEPTDCSTISTMNLIEPRSIIRKRLRPLVNLPAVASRQPSHVRFKEPVVKITEKSTADNTNVIQSVESIKILQESYMNAELKNSEGFVIPTSKNIPFRSKNLLHPVSVNSLCEADEKIAKLAFKRFCRTPGPSPRVLVNNAMKKRYLLARSAAAKLAGLVKPSEVSAVNRDSPVLLSTSDPDETLPPVSIPDTPPQRKPAQRPESPQTEEPSRFEAASQSQDALESDPTPTSKTEKRTTHRRLRKNGAGELLTRARRDFHLKFGNKTPDKKQLTMFDLIFYNPATNPMKPQEQIVIEKERNPRKVEDISERLGEESVDDVNAIGSDEESNLAMPAPQVKVGPDGSLIIDEKSLVIETTGAQKRRYELANSEVIMDYGIGNSTTYSSFTKRVQRKDWSKEETLKFYRALNSVGTDFLLMQSIFPKRTRKDLKQKFKKEDRLNRELIDKALKYPAEFDVAQLEKDLAQEEKENEEKRQKELQLLKEKEAKIPKKASGKRGQKPNVTKSFLEKSLDRTDTGPGCTESSTSVQQEATVVSEAVTNDSKPCRQPSKKSKKSRRRIKQLKPSSSSSSEEECIYSDVELRLQPPVIAEAAIPSLSTADDVDFSSSDDEITFLKTTRQTRYGRIPQRRVLSSESEEDEEEAEVTVSPSAAVVEPAEVPELSQVEPGSIVIFSTPGQSTYQLFMVGPRDEANGKSKMTPIGVSLTPEVLATMTSSTQGLGKLPAACKTTAGDGEHNIPDMEANKVTMPPAKDAHNMSTSE